MCCHDVFDTDILACVDISMNIPVRICYRCLFKCGKRPPSECDEFATSGLVDYILLILEFQFK